MLGLTTLILGQPSQFHSAYAEDPAPARPWPLAEQLRRGGNFLVRLFDPTLNLLPEYAGARVFWLYHDNYLAAKWLEPSHPDLARRIRAAIGRHGMRRSGKIEILFDESPDALSFRRYELMDVGRVGDARVRTEIVTTNVLTGWQDYADLLLFAAIAEAKPRPVEAREHFKRAVALGDGHGFSDRATKHNGLYATYKLALTLIAADHLRAPLPMRAAILAQLAALQNDAGGWITDYTAEGKPRGLANVETTCLVLFAIQTVAETK